MGKTNKQEFAEVPDSAFATDKGPTTRGRQKISASSRSPPNLLRQQDLLSEEYTLRGGHSIDISANDSINMGSFLKGTS